MMLTSRLWLPLAAFCAMFNHVEAQSPNRTRLEVEFEYKLEVNSTEGQSDIDSVSKQLQLWLYNIDQEIVPHLQEQISYEEQTRKMPNVKVFRVHSEIFNECYTESDGCRWVRSTFFMSYAKPKPQYSVERTTLNIAKDFLENFSNDIAHVHAAYTYPMLVSGTGRFEMNPVARTMNDNEIGIFEGCFDEVFASVVYAFDGDTEVTDSQFIYQDLIEDKNTTILVDIQYFGRCRHCDNEKFVSVVEGVVQDSMMREAFRDQLAYHGANQSSTYFDELKTITYSVREMPDDTPEISDKTIYDSSAPSSSSGLPWFLYVGIVFVVLIIILGVVLIYRDQKELKELMKDEMSTDSDSLSTRDNEDGSRSSASSHSSRSGTYDDEYTEDEVSKDDSKQASTVLSYVKEAPVTPSGQQKNEYEIYVY